MGAKVIEIVLPSGKSAKILKWKVKEGTIVSVGRVILLYDVNTNNGQEEQKKLKATQVGTVRKLLAKEGEIVHPGDALLELEECTHPTVMKDMCAECGADLRQDDESTLQNASIPMVHCIPELKVSKEQAQTLGKADERRLLRDKKLVLLVDLDQTLIHTTNDNIPANIKDVYHFQLYGAGSPWYHTRIRPGTHKFLTEMSKLYELHICTFGARNYAHMIAMFLDSDGKFFSHRILSRDECLNPDSKTANLTSLFPCGDNLVCIIDDREDVWNFAPNLVHVKPYHFFQHTGDINAPPGLAKCENDDKEGFDFTKITETNEKKSAESEVKENGDFKSESKRREGESEREDGELSEDSRLEPGDVTRDGANKSETKRKDVIESDSDSTEDKKDKTEEEAPEIKSDKMPPDYLEDDLELSDDEESRSEMPGNKITNKSDTTSATESEKTDEVVKEVTEDNTKKPEAPKEISKESGQVPKEESDNPSNQVESSETNENEKDKRTDSGKSEITVSELEDRGGGENKGGGDDDLVEVEDTDDYLLYLEEILKIIHKAFYELYDELNGDVPDLKTVIPYVRRKVLMGTSLVFSGLVPTHVPLEKSRAYLVARSLGAQVTQDLTPETTHLVAVRPGTAKVNAARRSARNVIIVTPDWLWNCAERWERVDERLFPLSRGGAANRHPPAHCGSPEHYPTHQQPVARHRTPSGRFMDTINPLMSFSSEDIAIMDREVEDIFNESESDGEIPSKSIKGKPGHILDTADESSSSSVDSLSGEHPHGWGRFGPTKRKRHGAGTATESDNEEEEEEDETPSAKFRRGEALPSDMELGEEDSFGSDEPPDEIDDGDWNMMGAALEREFLSGHDD